MATNKTTRRRVTADDVRSAGSGVGGSRALLRLPSGVESWSPDKAGTYNMDFLPYEVKTDKHPDAPKAIPTTLWYRYPFMAHRNIGPNDDRVICPGSIGQRCPICEERKRLSQNREENAAQIKALSPQSLVAYNIIDPEDKAHEKVVVFYFSAHNFSKPLDEELGNQPDEVCQFFDVIDGNGRTLAVRFGEDSFDGTKYLKATRFDFRDRKDMDENETLEKTHCLDDIVAKSCMSYDQLKALFLQVETEPGDGGDDEPAPTPAPRSRSQSGATSGAATTKPKETTPVATGKGKATTAAPKAEPKWVVGTKVQAGKWVGEVVEVDGDMVTIKTDDDKEHVVDVEDLVAVADEPAADEPAASTGAELKVGMLCKDKDSGDNCTVVKIMADDQIKVKIEGSNAQVIVSASDLEILGSDGGTDAEPEGEAASFAEGDAVTWEDGAKKGTVVKIKDGKIKVKDEDDTMEWVPEDDVKKAPAKGGKGKK